MKHATGSTQSLQAVVSGDRVMQCTAVSCTLQKSMAVLQAVQYRLKQGYRRAKRYVVTSCLSALHNLRGMTAKMIFIAAEVLQ